MASDRSVAQEPASEFHTLKAEQLLTLLKTSSKGLTQQEVQKRLADDGYNEFPEKQRSLVLLFFKQFHSVFIYILLVALGFSIALPVLEQGNVSLESLLDAFVIFLIIFLNAVLGFVQEYRAEEAIKDLRKLTAPHARVRRAGHEKMIPSRELVAGDIVVVEAGDHVTADCYLLDSSNLEINESMLTGESSGVMKNTGTLPLEAPVADRSNIIFAGTILTRGRAEAVVTSTGVRTEIGKIAHLMQSTRVPLTPLQIRLTRLSAVLGIVVVAFSALIVAAELYEGGSLLTAFLVGIALAVSAVPEGLPAVITVCFALGVRRMVKKNVLVRRLESLETLGSVTVICADKTGTITENRMKVRDVWVVPGGEEASLVQSAASCNRAELPDLGDPTEVGLLEYAVEKGIERLPIDEEEVSFTSEGKYMQCRHANVSFLKGAPEAILNFTKGQFDEEVRSETKRMAREGLRVLACARKSNGRFELLGLLGLQDPPRAEVKAAILQAKEAGIRSIMITGDHRETAASIAASVGIRGDVVEGKELIGLSTAQLRSLLERASVFARVSPEQKLTILEVLRGQGEIVAMTGDGVNDAPALKAAHIGIAMGQRGTDTARDASSIVLADDNYATIVAAIREGRRIYDNIRIFVLYLLCANFDELLLILTTTLLGLPLPLLPLQILWINLMTDSLPALALSIEPESPRIMKRPPRSAKEHLLAGEVGTLVIISLWSFGLALAFFLWQLARGISLDEARTATFTLTILFELFLVFSIRSREPIWVARPFRNLWLLAAVSVPLALHFVLLYTKINTVFHLVPLGLLSWLEILVFSFSGVVVLEILKVVRRR